MSKLVGCLGIWPTSGHLRNKNQLSFSIQFGCSFDINQNKLKYIHLIQWFYIKYVQIYKQKEFVNFALSLLVRVLK